MQSYGKVDASWDDARFLTVIEDVLEMAKENKKACAVCQDSHGNVMATDGRMKDPHVYACWTYAYRDKKLQEDKLELVDNVEYHDYSVEQMVPRVRDALTKGIVEYGGLRFLSEGRHQIGEAAHCAGILVRMHHGPFIVGLTAAGITVAPMSERSRFVEQAACVVTRHGCWSLADRIPDGEAYRDFRYRKRDIQNGKVVSDSRSIMVDPVMAVYISTLEYGKQKRQSA